MKLTLLSYRFPVTQISLECVSMAVTAWARHILVEGDLLDQRNPGMPGGSGLVWNLSCGPGLHLELECLVSPKDTVTQKTERLMLIGGELYFDADRRGTTTRAFGDVHLLKWLVVHVGGSCSMLVCWTGMSGVFHLCTRVPTNSSHMRCRSSLWTVKPPILWTLPLL